MSKRVLAIIFAFTLLAAACSSDDDTTSDSSDVTTEEGTADVPPDEDTDDAPPDESTGDAVTGPAEIAANSQSGDGTTVTVASVTLPTDGFVVIHGDDGGNPGPVIGHSDLLPAGESTDIVITLDAALDADGMVFPMAHVDANANGVYEFTPPDDTTDAPATREDGSVAVLGIDYSVADGGDELSLGTNALGDILVDGEGNTVYLFVPDGQADSACYDECEDAWPVVGELAAVGAGLDETLLGTFERTTGDTQATYNSWPLYYFAGDAAAGDANGQGVNAVWFVIDAGGDAIGG